MIKKIKIKSAHYYIKDFEIPNVQNCVQYKSEALVPHHSYVRLNMHESLLAQA